MFGFVRRTRRALVIASRLFAVLAMTLLFAGAAQAQDWVVNTSDAGFDPIPAAGVVQYVITVTNSDLDPAPATTLTLIVPATGILTSVTGAATGCAPTLPVSGPASVTCNLPALAPDEVISIGVSLETTQSGSITLGVSVPAVSGDPEPGNNIDNETTSITSGANFSLTVSAPASAAAGSTQTISFTALNNGPDTATNKTVQFPVPVGFIPGVLPLGCSLSGGTISCLIPGPVADNGTVTFAIPGQISAASGSTVTAAASVTGGAPPDAVPADNTATANITVTPGSDLAIGKTRSPAGTLVVGNSVSFILTSSYAGDDPTALVITDQVPVNYSVTSVVAPGWSCTITSGLVRCTRPNGNGAGENVALPTITINADVVSSGAPTNSARIQATGPLDSVAGNNIATDGGAVIDNPVVDLAASKTGPVPALVVQGATYTFDIGLSNLGNFNFIGTARMRDTLPAGMTVTAYNSNGWTCLPAAPVTGPATITCTRDYTALAPLAPGAAAPSVGLTTLMTATGSILNTVVVDSPNPNVPDLNTPNNTATYGVVGSPGANGANVSVIKSRTLATVAAGDIETFGIEIVNAGPQTATTVQVRDALLSLINGNEGATGAGFISATIAANTASGVVCSSTSSSGTSRQLNCNIASLPVCTAGSTCPVITVLVRPGGNAGSRANRVTAVSQNVADSDLTNNASNVTYAVEARADMIVAKSATPSPAAAGQNVTYILTATNVANGLSDAAAVVITDTLPADVTFVSASPSSGSCATVPAANSITGPGNNTLQCQMGTIANGAQRTVTVIVRPSTATRSTTLTNTVSVATSTVETNTTNNGASADVVVQNPSIDLLVNKTESVDPVAVGDDTVYTVSVRNLGPSAAENIVVTDTLPSSRLQYRSFTIVGGSCGTVPAVNSIGATMVCSFPSILAGETKAITVTMRGVVKGITTNNVAVRSDETALGFETNPGNDSTSETTTIRTRADVQVVSKVATPATVNLRDVFSYVVRVRNNTGALLAEADTVVVSDTLPSGMILAGTPTVAIVSGSASSTTCTGVFGAGSFGCALGTLSSGGTVDITVPVEVIAVTSRPQTFRNTASVTTTSLDVNAGNNSNFGDVAVSSSSVAGKIFRDFNNNAAVTGATDTGIAAINVTLAGTSQDGAAISITVATDSNGNFLFPFVPEGSYAISHAAIAETNLNAGTNTPGTGGGSNTNATTISGVNVAPATAVTGNLFAKVPQARIAVAKAVTGTPAIAADGGYSVTFGITVANLSLEALNTITVTDVLTGAAPKFGTYVALAVPASSPMTAGTYTIRSLSAGTCSSVASSFDGSSNTTLLTGQTLAAGQSCRVDVTVRVQPAAPLPPILASGGRYENQATVTGVGVLSGQTSATIPQLSDLSDNGTNPDTDGDGTGNEAGENDPTPVAPGYAPSIALIKTASTAAFSQPVQAGNQISYTFAVTNTGNVTLTNITLTDPLTGIVLTGGPIASLAPNATDSTTFTAIYSLTNADLLAKRVNNQATATGTWSTTPGGAAQTVNDLSGSTNTTNAPTVVRLGAIDLVKSADTSAITTPARLGQIVTYRFVVTNIGPVALTNVTVTDPLTGLTMSGGPIANLGVGASDSTTFTATYAITQSDIDSGSRANQATASGAFGVDGSGNPILATDLSGNAAQTDAQTLVPLTRDAKIELIKRITGVADTNGNALRDAGDTVSYAFSVTNTGNLGLAAVTVSDPRVSLTGSPFVLGVGATNSTAYTATYVLTQADVDRGYRQNTASVTANARAANGTGALITNSGGTTITATDVSDTATNPDLTVVAAPATTETPNGAGGTDADPTNDPTVALITPIARIQLSKSLVGITDTNGNGYSDVGDTVRYSFAVRNTGNVALGGVTLSDPLITEVGGPITLAVGATNTTAFTGTYVLTLADLQRQYVDNSATVSGNAQTTGGIAISVGGAPLTTTDVSDSGTDRAGAVVTGAEAIETPNGAGATDGNTTNDPTVATLAPAPRLRLVKSAISVVDVNTNGQTDAGDRVTYRFSVTNVGNVALQNVTVSDPLVTVVGGAVNLAIAASDTTTFTASYVMVQADLDRGYVENTATTLGNAVNATGDPILGAGGVQLTATDVSDAGSTPGLGTVTNPETTETPSGTGATDGNTTNDVTVVTLAPDARIVLIKRITGVADTNGDGLRNAGDTVSYVFDITNAGNVALRVTTVSDPVVTVTGSAITLAPKASQTAAFGASYLLTQTDIDRGYAQNSATVTGAAQTTAGAAITTGGNAVTATDVSDTGTNPDLTTVTDPAATETPNGAGGTDTNPTNDPTVATIAPVVGILLTKSLAGITDTNGNGFTDVGDTVNYRFSVTNTGNVALGGVAIADPLITETGGPIVLAAGATNSSAFTGQYVLTVADLSRRFVDNSATVSGNAQTTGGTPILVGGTPLTASDVSDTGTDRAGATVAGNQTVESPSGAGLTDSDPTNDPTVAVIAPSPRISLIKRVVSVSDTNGDSLTNVGDVVTYAFTVTNTGNTALSGIVVTDNAATVSSTPISLAIGASNSTSFTATYTLTQADLDRGYKENTATTTGNAVDAVGSAITGAGGAALTAQDVSDTGTDPNINPVIDPETTETPSGTGATDGNPTNDPTVLNLRPEARITLVKRITLITDTTGNGVIGVGDTVTYGFSVTNTGNVPLGGIGVTDPLVTVAGGPIALAPRAVNSTAFTAAYVLTQSDVDAGFIQNSATAIGNAETTGGAPILGINGVQLTATDVSDTGTNSDLSVVTNPALTESPDGSGGIDADPTNDPTVGLITPDPRIVLVKSLVGIADTNGTGFADAGDTVSYTFSVTNTGNVALGNIIVTDPLVAVSGTAISLAVGGSNTTAFGASYVLIAADVTRGYVDNSATVAGRAETTAGIAILGPDGEIPATDTSDSGTTPAGAGIGNPGGVETLDGAGGSDGNPTNDPTVAALTPEPRIQLVKSAVSFTDVNANGQTDVGDRISYRFAVTNTGNVALQGITVTDLLVTVSGGPLDLAIGASNTTAFTASYVLVQADLDRGFVDNTATTTGNAVTAAGVPILGITGAQLVATDTSDSGSTPALGVQANAETTETPTGSGAVDGNPTNDPTVVTLAPQVQIALIKRITGIADTNTTGRRDAGDTVSYAFDITNTGNVGLGTITVTDPLVTVAGGPITLAPKASAVAAFTAIYVLTQADIDRGYVQNSATADGFAQTAGGVAITGAGGVQLTATDVSDTGTNPDLSAVANPATTETLDGAGGSDSDPTNDPTVGLITQTSAITLIKTVSLAGLSDPISPGQILTYGFTVQNTGAVTLNNVAISDPLPGVVISGGPIASLAPGAIDSTTFSATYPITAADIAATQVVNQARATGNYGPGNSLQTSDLSGTTATNDLPTTAIVGTPKIKFDINIIRIVDTNGNGITDPGDVILYSFTITNTGDVTLTGANVDYSSLSLNIPGLNCAPVTLLPGQSAVMVCTNNGYTIQPSDTGGPIILTGTASATSPIGSVVTDASAAASVTALLGGITLTKQAGTATVKFGDSLTWTIIASNPATGLDVTTTVVDTLPAGFVYQAGSVRVNGVAVPAQISGQRLSIANVPVAAGTSTTITLITRVTQSARPGRNTNRAVILNGISGEPLAPEATAVVKVAVEAVFDCATVIGRVFDDRNQDGYMNGIQDAENRDALTDQTYVPSGKFGADPAQAQAQGEPGLPNVRLISPNGVSVTTDEYGRFSLPCAALPRDIGSNFSLKLDPRSLPSGYRLTSENPRVVRLTPGMITKLNFGATLSRVVRIDLAANAFVTVDGKLRARPELEAGVRQMVTQIANQPSMLRLSYRLAVGEDQAAARKRLQIVDRMLHRLWPANGRYQLNIETTLLGADGKE